MRASRRNNAFLIVASIAASVALFACSGDREASGVTPENAAHAEAARPAPASSQGTNPAPAADAVAQAPEAPVENPWAIERVPAAQADNVITFGSDGEEDLEEGAARAAKKTEPLPGTAGHVFTNKDLHRYRPLKAAFGLDDEPAETTKASAAAQKKDGASGDEDPRKPEGENAKTPEEIQAEIDQTQVEIAKAEEDLAYLKSRPASIHNPFLPRVSANEKDAAAEDGMDNVQKLAHVNARIAETEARINTLRQKLESLSQPPPSNQ